MIVIVIVYHVTFPQLYFAVVVVVATSLLKFDVCEKLVMYGYDILTIVIVGMLNVVTVVVFLTVIIMIIIVVVIIIVVAIVIIIVVVVAVAVCRIIYCYFSIRARLLS